jgi:hypothetical protein
MIGPTSYPGDRATPFIVGWIKAGTKSFKMGLYFPEACAGFPEFKAHQPPSPHSGQ